MLLLLFRVIFNFELFSKKENNLFNIIVNFFTFSQHLPSLLPFHVWFSHYYAEIADQ